MDPRSTADRGRDDAEDASALVSLGRMSRRRFITAAGVAAAAFGGASTLAVPAAAESTLRNLAAGASYGVTAGRPNLSDGEGDETSYPETGNLLTDGQYSGTEFTDAGWRGYLRQDTRTIAIDLGKIGTVQKVLIDYLFYPSAAVYLPNQVRVALSMDGKTWRLAGTAPGDNVGTVNEHRVVGVEVAPTYARYVQVHFDVNGWAFVDEIEVLGTEGIEPGTREPTGEIVKPDSQDPGQFLRQGTGQVGGVKNMFLAYTYWTQSELGEVGKWSAEDLREVITHVDSDSVSTDWMWDTVLLMAGGSELDGYPDQPRWDDLLDRLFEPDINIDALDQAVATARQTLDDDGQTIRLVLPIPNPVATLDRPWGSLNGEELDLNPTRVGAQVSAANRLRVVHWYIDQALQRLRAARHRNFRLAGFYWMREQIAPRSSDSALVQKVSALLHDRPENLRFYWIPWFQSAGFAYWRDYGFDASMMQPNYFFDRILSPTDTSRLELNAEIARWSGQGVELEIDEAALTDAGARQKWLNYLEVDRATSADKAIKGYYWGTRTTFQAMVESTDPEVRAMYDAAYEFIRRSR
ncbi:DUF4855 domain-containing protein [Actinopolymorpha rutila]|uniref:F5/8 type C domain-containing protein n=1 Tax=Actinopolymorpha rutila TaxID=446787 RepID=A0A852ZLI8_9ACTN|nr:DUF4855 domain-containing protein [Actinopolymorpha rutila]NYH92472.1 hypothetical protein [Actinopolymorpha rutila]